MLQPSLEPPGVAAFCDMDRNGGGWTVVIRRNDTEYQDDFQQDWDSYKMGFGYLGGEFYWGNEYVWMLTSHLDRRYQVYFWLEDCYGNTRYAIYQNFWIEAEADHYRLHLGPYSGDAGDSFSFNNNQAFTTYDRDYDSWDKNCAESDICAGGWWYNACTLGFVICGKFIMHFDWMLFFTEFPEFVFMTTDRCPRKDKTVDSSKSIGVSSVQKVSSVSTETQKMSSLTFESYFTRRY